jgi:hypothetical protein
MGVLGDPNGGTPGAPIGGHQVSPISSQLARLRRLADPKIVSGRDPERKNDRDLEVEVKASDVETFSADRSLLEPPDAEEAKEILEAIRSHLKK